MQKTFFLAAVLQHFKEQTWGAIAHFQKFPMRSNDAMFVPSLKGVGSQPYCALKYKLNVQNYPLLPSMESII